MTQPATRLPLTAVLLGIAGLIPFLGAGLGAVNVDQVLASRALSALMTYGAVILAFLGGVHWGFALSPQASASHGGTRARLILGVIPSLIGWSALLLAIVFTPAFGLGLLILGFVVTLLAEVRAARRGLMPSGYLWLRWGVSIIVVTVLATVLVLLVLGGHIRP